MSSKITLTEARNLRASMMAEMQPHFRKWSLISRLIAPERFNTNPDDSSYGARKGIDIIKTEPSLALRIFKAGFANGATPRTRPWFKMQSDERSNRNHDARKYTGYLDRLLSSRLQNSNFYKVQTSSNTEFGAFSNSAYMMLPHASRGVWFFPLQLGTYAFKANIFGEVDMFCRDFVLNVREVVNEYCTKTPSGHIDFSSVPEWVKIKYEQARYTDKVYLSTLIVPNAKYNPLEPKLYPWQKKFQIYTWIEGFADGNGALPPQQTQGFGTMNASQTTGSTASNSADKNFMTNFMKVSGLGYFPVIVPRWEVAAEKSVGIEGPGDMALNAMIVFQKMEKDRLKAVDKLLDPAMLADSSLKKHGSSIMPGGITYLNSSQIQYGFRPAYQVDPKVAELLGAKGEYLEVIQSSFFQDIFMMISNERAISHVSAAEINERAGERMAIISPMLTQFDGDVGDNVLNNILEIEREAGRLIPPPRVLEGQKIAPFYTSILAQASRASNITTIERTTAYFGGLATTTQDPSILKLLNAEKMAREYADYAGLDPDLILSESEFSDVKEAIASQEAQAQAQANAAVDASIAKDLSQASSPSGSQLDNMNQMSQL